MVEVFKLRMSLLVLSQWVRKSKNHLQAAVPGSMGQRRNPSGAVRAARAGAGGRGQGHDFPKAPVLVKCS